MLNKLKALLLGYLNKDTAIGRGVRVVAKTFSSALVLGLVGFLGSVHSWAPNDLKNAAVGLVVAAGAAALHVAENLVKNRLDAAPAPAPAPPAAPAP